jgi:hypothetical protein
MPKEKGLFEGLADFSFQELITTRIIKLLYGIALLAGGISVVVVVFNGLRESPAQGLLALVFGLIGLFIWVLYVRVLLEVLVILFRIAAHTERMAGAPNP